MDSINSRLRRARIKAGFKSARSAAARFGWSLSTYAAHENGQNGYDNETAIVYAKAFKTDASWLLLGLEYTDVDYMIPVVGKIGENGFIKMAPNNTSESGFFQVNSLVRFPEGGVGYLVIGNSLWPRYDDGDLIICMKAGPSYNLGNRDDEEAIVLLDDGRYCIRIVERIDESPFKSDKNTELNLRYHNTPAILKTTGALLFEIWLVIPVHKWSKVSADTLERQKRAAHLT